MRKESLIKGYILVILSAFLFGCMPLITKYIYAEGVSRETVVLLRNLLALPALAALTWRKSRSFAIPVKALPSISLLALVGCCITTLLLYGSYQYIASGTATVFHFVYPVVVVLIELIFMRKKIYPGTAVAVFLCVGGVCLFYNPAEPLDWTGCALALISGVTYVVYVVLLSGFRYKQVSDFKLTLYISAICAGIMLVICLVTDKLTLPTTLTGWLLCILLSQLIGVGGVAMFQSGVALIGGERTSVLSALEPLTGVIMGVAVFSEKVTFAAGIGMVMVIGACVMIALVDAKKKA